MKFDRNIIIAKFTDFYNKQLLLKITNTQKKDINILFDYIERDNWPDVRYLANFLAQCGHESGWTFKAVKEVRGSKGTKIREIQDKYWDTGAYGRGLIQVTHARNYEKLAQILQVPELAHNYDLMLTPEISYKAASIGMKQGIFTGRKLSDFIYGSTCDYRNCRKIINPNDFNTYERLAKFSSLFESILRESLVKDSAPSRVKIEEDIEPKVEKAAEIVDIVPDSGKNEVPTSEPIILKDANTIEEVVKIAPHVAEKVKGMSTWKTVLTTIASSVSVSLASIYGWIKQSLSDPLTGKIFLIAAITLIIVAIGSLIVYILMRNMTNLERERFAHERTMKELEIRANPELTNVEVHKE